jgi:hypothetical protein
MSEFEYDAGELTRGLFSRKGNTLANASFMEQKEPNYFRELLDVLTEEELIRLRHRLRKVSNLRTAEILGDEIQARNVDTQQESTPCTHIDTKARFSARKNGRAQESSGNLSKSEERV